LSACLAEGIGRATVWPAALWGSRAQGRSTNRAEDGGRRRWRVVAERDQGSLSRV
jgi:hypothetical protein